jgi:hypothetical protein
MHGPYSSVPNRPHYVSMDQVGLLRLRRPFFVGMMQGMGDKATLVDGGEIYQLRTADEFKKSYQ